MWRKTMKDNWIKEFDEMFAVDHNSWGDDFHWADNVDAKATKIKSFISQVEKDAYQLGLRDGIKKEHENSGAWTELNKQGVINTHKLIKDAKSESYTNGYRDGFDAGVEKTNKRWREKIINYFAGAGELWFDYIGLTKEEQKRAAIDELSDLLEDKHEV